MKTATILGIFVLMSVCAAALQVTSPSLRSDLPKYVKGNELARPEGYREWVYLSSGLGMNYSDTNGEGGTFTNVFVAPSAYHQFMATGRWPDQTVFVVEERRSSSKGSINKAGHFQTDLMGMGVEVKDQTRFPEKWAYFNFDRDAKTAKANPKAACWQCHNDHAAVENTFVQFYPTLKPVARHFGTYKQAVEAPDSSRK